MSISVDSLPIERPLVVGANSEGYYRKKLLFPNVAFEGADSVTAINLTAGGTGYTTAPNVVFTASGTGSGAAATSVLGFGIILVNVTAPGTYTTLPSISATVGTGAVFVPHVYGVSLAIQNAGTGYNVSDTINIDGGAYGATSLVLTVLTVGAGGSLSTFSISTAGDYTAIPSNPVASTGSGIGSGATFNVSWGILSIAVVSDGQNYDSTTQIVITATGSGGVANPVLASGGNVKAINLVSGGSDYNPVPTISFSGGGGSGAAATAVMGAGDNSTVSLVFSSELETDNYTVKGAGNDACVVSSANKSIGGVDVIFSPLNGDVLSAGIADIVIQYTA